MEQISGIKNDESNSVADNNNVISLQASKVSKVCKQDVKLQNLGTRIPATTLKRFRSFVLDRHGKINGPFSQEVANALEFYLNKQQQSTSYTYSNGFQIGPKRRGDVNKRCLEIAIEFRKLKSYPVVNAFTIKRTIKNVLGDRDPRTLNKYLNIIRKLSIEEANNSFGHAPLFNVSRFVEKIQQENR